MTNPIFMKRSPLNKHIYRQGNKYSIYKSVNGKNEYFGRFDSLNEAQTYRDKLIANGWKPLPETEEEIYQREWQKYYMHIYPHSCRTLYAVIEGNKYHGICHTIEEALHYRDLALNGETRKPYEMDLQKNNPYLDGLEYPVPERLQLKKKDTGYGKGYIKQKGEWSFHVHHGSKLNGKKSYVCACRTREQAEYVRMEMNKCGWDRSQLQRILDDYPKYYTWLLFFYQYITKDIPANTKEWNGRYKVTPPLEHNNGKLEHIVYSNLEDALFERDFLKEHGWDYDLLVETIDDSENSYYDMELPPWPTRRIKHVDERNYHEEELSLAVEMIRQGYSQRDIAKELGITGVTFRNWLRNWNTGWEEFCRIIENGENPLDVLEKVELILQPDLSKPKPSNFSNYVGEYHTPYGIRYNIQHKGIGFGSYPTRELALKISKDMQKLGWDKSRLEEVQAKHGWRSMMGSRRWVYPNKKSWSVRHKTNGKMINYGTYHDVRVANIVRDLLIEHDWNKEVYPMLREIAEWVIHIYDLLPCTMFGKVAVEDIEYLEDDCRIPYTRPSSNSDKLIVGRTFKGKYTYYGIYSEDKAREVVEFLEDNNWDKELLKAMEEMGEI